jgi:short-subunit dehydrogenase
MTKRLEGTVALVTGASSGIGEAPRRVAVNEMLVRPTEQER